MWSFPILSIALSFSAWKRWKNKFFLSFLTLGMALQGLNYLKGKVDYFSAGFVMPSVSLYALVCLGRGLLLAQFFLLLSNFLADSSEDKSEKIKRIGVKLFLLFAFASFTIANLKGDKAADTVQALLFITLPALYWRQVLAQEFAVQFATFLIVFVAFFTYLLKYNGVFNDFYLLGPLVWMLSFTACYYMGLNIVRKN